MNGTGNPPREVRRRIPSSFCNNRGGSRLLKAERNEAYSSLKVESSIQSDEKMLRDSNCRVRQVNSTSSKGMDNVAGVASSGQGSIRSDGVPSVNSGFSIPHVPSLNLSLIRDRGSIAFSGMGSILHDTPPVPMETQLYSINRTSNNSVLEHLNRVQDDLNKHLRSVRLEYQRSMSNSALSGSSKKRSSRLMSVTSEDTHSIHSESSSLRLVDQKFERVSSGNHKESNANMHIGRQRTYQVPQPSDNLPCAKEMSYSSIRGVLSNERDKLLNMSLSSQDDAEKTPSRSRPVRMGSKGTDSSGVVSNTVHSTPVHIKSTPNVFINRKKGIMYDSDMVKGLIRNVCAKETAIDTSYANENKETSQDSGVKNPSNEDSVIYKPDAKMNTVHEGVYNMKDIYFPLPRKNIDAKDMQQQKQDANKVTDRFIEDGKVSRLGTALKGVILQSQRNDDVTKQPVYGSHNRDYRAMIKAALGRPIKKDIDRLSRDSYSVISVDPSEVELISRHYAEAEKKAIKEQGDHEDRMIQRNMDKVALTHLPTISGNNVKDLSSYTLEQLIELSRVNTKCALLQERGQQIRNAPESGEKNPLNSEITSAVSPWFEDPLVEKMRRKKPVNVTYECYLPTSAVHDGSDPLLDKDILFYMEQRATYRLDLEEHERHGVMDPFYEYERVKQNKTPSTSDWAKYGRPITKH